ncbi:MAG: PilZ domain-containing protein [Chloroflexota bacterium]
MPDQRREARKKLIAFTPVYKLDPKVLLGYLVDLTPHGAKVEGERAVEVNQRVGLAIEFPDGMSTAPGAPFSVAARVTRCAPGKSPRYFDIGFEFTDPTPEQAKVIEAIIERYAFRREEFA